MFIQPGGRLVALTAPTTGWRPARTRKLLAFALGATALTAMLLTFSAWRSPAQAFAACGASTPANVTVPDAQDDGVFGDGSPGLGFAPDLAAVSAAVDGNCGMTISLSRHGFSGADWLFDFESVGLFVNTDGNAATGGPAGAERKILVDGNSPGPDARITTQPTGPGRATRNKPVAPSPRWRLLRATQTSSSTARLPVSFAAPRLA